MTNVIIVKKGFRYAIQRDDRKLIKWLAYEVDGIYMWSIFKDWFPSDIISWRFKELTGKHPNLEGSDGVVDSQKLISL